MRRLLLLCLALAGTICSYAQHRITLRIGSLPSYHKQGDAVYLAGSFNNWNPGQPQMRFENRGGVYTIDISLQKGTYEYKLTRGSWETAEAAAGGAPASNRVLQVASDTLIELSIPEWADHLKGEKRRSANKNVTIIDTAFFMPQLNRYRRIWICLPESYTTSRKRYPVLYMHDGQNLFDDATAFSGEWGVDEAMDSLGPKVQEMIVVGIDNGGDTRINEYSPYNMERFGKGEGAPYVDFLVKTLRPYINKHYRTRRCGKHSYTAGSSMGGLISFYALMKYPKKFGGAGVFSPAFWVTPELFKAIPADARKIKGRIYFYAGMQEGDRMVPDMLAVFELMRLHTKADMTTVIRTEGKHNEATWRQEFPRFYKWLFAKNR
ncbi:MAG TPA: alpha/beta hydrolase-fold protein [Chitinophagaceae bacterium]